MRLSFKRLNTVTALCEGLLTPAALGTGTTLPVLAALQVTASHGKRSQSKKESKHPPSTLNKDGAREGGMDRETEGRRKKEKNDLKTSM